MPCLYLFPAPRVRPGTAIRPGDLRIQLDRAAGPAAWVPARGVDAFEADPSTRPSTALRT